MFKKIIFSALFMLFIISFSYGGTTPNQTLTETESFNEVKYSAILVSLKPVGHLQVE